MGGGFLASFTSAFADVVYQQPPSPSGGLLQSSLDGRRIADVQLRPGEPNDRQSLRRTRRRSSGQIGRAHV